MNNLRNFKRRWWLLPAILWAVLIPQLQSQQGKTETKPSTAVKNDGATPKAADEATAPKNGVTADEETEEVDVTADELEENHKTGTRLLTGNVHIDREDGSYLYSDKLTQFWEPNDKKRTVTRTLAQGNVQMKETDDDITATCDEAEFMDDNNIIDLRGSVVVLQEDGRLEAKRFNYNRNTGKRIGSGGVKIRMRLARKKPVETAPAAANGSAAPPDSEKESAAIPTGGN